MNNYAKGRRVEQEVIDLLGARGYDCVRSAGSKGAADVVAFHDDEACLIQVKAGASILPGPAERRELLRMSDRSSRFFALVAFKEPNPDDRRRKRIVFRELTGPGPKDHVPWIPRARRTDDGPRPLVHVAG